MKMLFKITFTSNIRITNSHTSSQENVYGVAIMILRAVHLKLIKCRTTQATVDRQTKPTDLSYESVYILRSSTLRGEKIFLGQVYRGKL